MISHNVVDLELLLRKFDGHKTLPDKAMAYCFAPCPLQVDAFGRRSPVRIRKQGPPPGLTQSAAGCGNVVEA
jgi:hypothetical protein